MAQRDVDFEGARKWAECISKPVDLTALPQSPDTYWQIAENLLRAAPWLSKSSAISTPWAIPQISAILEVAEEIKDIIGNDERLKDFHALETGRVFNHTKRIARNVANDYWESGIVQPDVVLADLIRIFHPELLPDHDLYYYQKLN